MKVMRWAEHVTRVVGLGNLSQGLYDS